MSHEELLFASISDLAELYRKREVSPVDMTVAALERIQRQEPQLNAYTLVTGERALSDAREAEAKLLRNESVSPLCGIPVSLKDIFDVDGLPMTCGSNVLKGRHVSRKSATVAQRLFDAGVVLLGKNNLLEFAYGATHPDFGPTRNPWDLERSTMGSSTGSGATVAARQAFASLGTDTGGSVRLPASYCGLVGLKPSYGLVSRHGLGSLAWSCDYVGPLTRTVMDAAIVMNTIAGFDPKDPTSADQPVPDFVRALGQSIRGLKVGVITREFDEPAMDPEVREAVLNGVELLRTLGAEVVEVSLPGVEGAIVALTTTLLVEASAYHQEWLEQRPEGYSSITRERLKLGSLITGVQYVQAQRYRRIFCESVNEVLSSVDVLISPTSVTTAHRLADEGKSTDLAPLIRTTGPFNLSGHPAVSVPCGFSSDRLPIGMQIVGRPHADHTVLRVAHQYQQATAWHLERPPEL